MPRKKDEVRLGNMQRMWRMGRSGPIDYVKRAKVAYPWSKAREQQWLSNSGHADLEFYDIPCDDIDVIKVHGRNIYIGGKYRKSYRNHVASILTNNFTRAELNAIGNLYIETAPRTATMEGAAGVHTGFTLPPLKRGGKRIKGSSIRIAPAYQNRKTAFIHEMIHAVRFAQGRYVRDVDREEKETELETIARVGTRDLSGYYKFTSDPEGSIAHDKRIMVGNTVHGRLKGKAAIRRTEKCYNKSKIKDVHFSPAEYIDRYFIVKTSTGAKHDVHIRFLKGSNLNTIRSNLKKRYGKHAQMWEWRDGKKVKISSKRTIKKRRK